MIPDINAPSISGTKHDHFTALATLTPNSRAVSRADRPPTTDAELALGDHLNKVSPSLLASNPSLQVESELNPLGNPKSI